MRPLARAAGTNQITRATSAGKTTSSVSQGPVEGAPPDLPSGYSMPLSAIVRDMGLMRVAGGHLDLSAIEVTTSEVNRPGLQLTGYTQHFSSDRLQIIGWTETGYLRSYAGYMLGGVVVIVAIVLGFRL